MSSLYLFNVETTFEVKADSEEDAMEILAADGGEYGPGVRLIGNDIMLVETICLHHGDEDASDCENGDTNV